MTTDNTSPKDPLALKLNEGLGLLPPQRKGQYLTMTICGTNDDPAECGHWSSPAHVQWRIDKAVAAENERGEAEIDRLCAAIYHKDAALVGAAIEIQNLRAQLKLYRDEAPLGHHPHMIAT